jgi:hypothetical protein
VVTKVKVTRRRLAAAGLVAGMLVATGATAGSAHAATAPLKLTFVSCGTGSTTGWNNAEQPVLTPGTASGGQCQNPPAPLQSGSAYAALDIGGSGVPSTLVTEPTFTATTPAPGDTVRMVVLVGNGQALTGYSGRALSGQSGPDAAGMAWAVGNSTTYTDYQTAYAAAEAAGGAARGSGAYIVATADPGAGSPVTVTSVQLDGRTMGPGVVTITTPGPQTVTIGTATADIWVDADTSGTDQNIVNFTVTGLPDGLRMEPFTPQTDNAPAAQVVVTGTPAADAKSGTATVTATDAYGVVGTTTLAFTVNPAVITISHGKGLSLSPTRENVTWQQTAPSWVKMTVTGPGPINGKVDEWQVTSAGPGVAVTGFVTGLEANHTYAAVITPTATKGGAPVGPPARIDFVTS